jgi:uncharacterized radical SAM protein YgiQ
MIATSGRDFDVILVSAEPYVDHPLSAVGVIARALDSQGYRIGVVGRPNWRGDLDFLRLGRPRLFFGITSGSMDSLLVNYSPLKRERRKDPHAPRSSGMPDRAVLVYANKVRHLFPGAAIVIGGIEASLRRFAHYDYWDDKVRRGLLLDARADILVYGPGEKPALEIAARLARGEDLAGVPGTCVVRKELPAGFEVMPPFEDVAADPGKFCEAQRRLSNRRHLAQAHAGRFVLQFPAPVATSEDLDWVYGLPYSREIPDDFPEFAMARFSVVTHRGCLGNCSFCSLALHQGDRIVSRSEESILGEIRCLTRHPDFKGYIDDLGGPTANMYGMDCDACVDRECLKCRRLDLSHRRLTRLLREARAVPGVKKVFVRSGIRYDLAMSSPDYLAELCRYHVSGRLKIAPEHVSAKVLALMNKGRSSLDEFRRLYKRLSGDRSQGLVCYFMIGHPGTSEAEARELATYVRRLKRDGVNPVEGVQVFTPTPMTRSTCMYHTGLDPATGGAVFVPRSFREKKDQKRMLG